MRLKTVVGILLILPVLASAALAQGVPITTDGVYIDGKGVLHSKKKQDTRLAEIQRNAKKFRKDGAMVYISLPRLFAEAQKLQKDGKELPDRIKYLGGMVKLQYVFVYPEDNDIVIAGPSEPFDKNDFRPLGLKTGRPVIQLDDLVTALRASGPGRGSSFLGCDLEMNKDIVDRIKKKTKEIQPKVPSIGHRRAAELIAEAGGYQPIKYFGVGSKSRFAVVCIEADYMLKQLQIGLIKSPTRKVKTYMAMASKPEKPHRFALESDYEAISVSPDGHAYELKGNSLKVISTLFSVSKQSAKSGDISHAARKFVDMCNANFPELVKGMISWADLSNLSDLAVLSALIAEDGLHKKAEWDLSWVMDGYKVREFQAPSKARTLCNYRHYGQMTIFTSGGVALTPRSATKNRARNEKMEKADRPEGEDWISSTRTK